MARTISEDSEKQSHLKYVFIEFTKELDMECERESKKTVKSFWPEQMKLEARTVLFEHVLFKISISIPNSNFQIGSWT